MKKHFLRLGFFVLFVLIAGCATTTTTNVPSLAKEKEDKLKDFPVGYQDWTNTVAKVNFDKTSPFYGFQRVLVSKEALTAYKKGGQYPEGAQLILEFSEPMEEGNVVKGKTIWIAVMRKNKTAASTGGWIFDAYDCNDSVAIKKDIDPVVKCFNCHTAMKNKNYIFSSAK